MTFYEPIVLLVAPGAGSTKFVCYSFSSSFTSINSLLCLQQMTTPSHQVSSTQPVPTSFGSLVPFTNTQEPWSLVQTPSPSTSSAAALAMSTLALTLFTTLLSCSRFILVDVGTSESSRALNEQYHISEKPYILAHIHFRKGSIHHHILTQI